MQNAILTVYREPFGIYPQVRRFPEGMSLYDMRLACDFLPDDFDEGGAICINGDVVPRPLWGLVKPKLAVTEITFHAAIQGGGESGGGKNVLMTVAGIGLAVLSGGIASGAILGTLTGAAGGVGTVASIALASAVSYGGSLLLASLIPPPSDDDAPKALKFASASGNILAPNVPIPRVVGKTKIFPPMAMEPYIYFKGQDERVEALYVLDGPHKIENIRINDIAIGTIPDLEYTVLEGWDTDDAASIIGRYAKNENVGKQLRGYMTVDDEGEFVDQTSDSPLPLKQVFITKRNSDWHELQIMFPSGFMKTDDSGSAVTMPFRFRIRAVGSSTWLNLPEVHYISKGEIPRRLTVFFNMGSGHAAPAVAAGSSGWKHKFNSVPGQTLAPASSGWTADALFSGGGSPLTLGTNMLFIDLNQTDFPAERYEIEILRGAIFTENDFNSTTYALDGIIYNLFGYFIDSGKWKLARDQSKYNAAAILVRSVSVFTDPPLPQPGMAAILIKTVNRQVDEMSVDASGYVRDWNGSAWANWTTTSNPAPHLRDILIGDLNKDPLPSGILDDNSMLNWRGACNTLGYEVNAIIEDKSIDEAARVIAACGYGTLIMSDTWAVVWDHDRSVEAPTQLFSDRNMKGFRYSKAFARVPDGFLVNFKNKATSYEEDQITVMWGGGGDKLEQINYEGLVTEAEVEQRATYDLSQARYRSTFYTFEAPAETIICRKGDLVGVTRNMLSQSNHSARITDWTGSPNVTALVVDGRVSMGAGRGIMFVSAIGSMTVAYTTTDGYHLTLTTPVPIGYVVEGSLITTGPIASVAKRMLVFEVVPRIGYTATVTLIDEAPEVWAAIEGLS